jgi:hypothetical protein
MRVVARAALASAFVVVLSGGTARAQATAGTPPVASVAPPAPAAAAPEKAWSFSASAYTYVLPDDPDYVQPTIAADHGWLHLEGRFNYEDLDTGSAWFGYNFSVGETITLEFTPGYKGSLGWGKLDLSSETEYVIDTGSSADSFLYTWSELGLTPVDWCRFGLVVQRSKAYKTEFDIQRGFFAGISYNRVDVTAYVFNPDASRPIIVVGVGVSF